MKENPPSNLLPSAVNARFLPMCCNDSIGFDVRPRPCFLKKRRGFGGLFASQEEEHRDYSTFVAVTSDRKDTVECQLVSIVTGFSVDVF